MSRIKRVLITGGTHGNELIGVYLIKKFERSPALIRRSGFEVFTLLANPQAVAACRRYIDQDLNRSFATQTTEKATNPEYELQRAEEIRNQFGQTGRTPIDFIIDLHGTTSNAGIMLILDSLDTFMLNLAGHLSCIEPGIKIYCSMNSGRKQDSVRSLAPCRVGIEVGPVAHGTLHAELFQKTEALTYKILDFLDQDNWGVTTGEKLPLMLYQYAGTIDYPRDENDEILAMIHPQLQFKDYEALNPGDPMFLTLDGETIVYQGDATTYPIFINEAAYYEKGIAMCFTQMQRIESY